VCEDNSWIHGKYRQPFLSNVYKCFFIFSMFFLIFNVFYFYLKVYYIYGSDMLNVRMMATGLNNV